MKDLKDLFINQFSDITTYLQSGNMVFSLKEKRDSIEIERIIEQTLLNHYQFEVHTVVLHIDDYFRIVDANPFLSYIKDDITRAYIAFFKTTIALNTIDELENLITIEDKISLTKEALYIYYASKCSDSKLTNVSVERKGKVIATTRNWKTVMKVGALLKEGVRP